MIRRAVASVVLPLVLALGGAAGLSGQSTLDRIEELAHAGRTHEARRLLTDWWAVERDGAGRDDLQRGIWLRGVLTVDPEEAALDFRRLLVEYPTGPYTAPALARVAGAALVTGDTARAVEALETLVRWHAATPQGKDAREWLGAREEAGRAAGATAGADVPPTDTAGREDASSGGGDGASTEDADATGPGGDGSASAGRFTVQLGAFAGAGRAAELLERARAAGLEPRLVRVPPGELARVRVGRFATGAEADAFRLRVVELGFDALVSDTADREVPAGG